MYMYIAEGTSHQITIFMLMRETTDCHYFGWNDWQD